MWRDRGEPIFSAIAARMAAVRGWWTKCVASMNTTPLAAAAWVMRRTEAWSTNGLSTRTCLPAAIAASAISSFATVGVAM